MIGQLGVKVGSTAKVSVQVADDNQPAVLIQGEVTALEAEFDQGGTFTVIRGYDQLHRFFRARVTASYLQATASDIATAIAHRAGPGPATCRRPPRCTTTTAQSGRPTGRCCRGWPGPTTEVSVRDGVFGFTAPANANTAPTAVGTAQSQPLVLTPGKDLLRFRAVPTSAAQVDTVEVRLGCRDQAGAQGHPARENRPHRVAVGHPGAARPGVRGPAQVATDVPYRAQSEVDEAARVLADEVASSFAEFEGTARGRPELRAGAAISIDGLGSPFDGKYTITTSRHRFDPQTGYTTCSRSPAAVTAPLLGLAGGGTHRVPSSITIGQVSDVSDPQQAGRVRLTFLGCRTTTSATGHAPCSRAPERTVRCCPRWATR